MSELSPPDLLTHFLFSVNENGRTAWYGVSGYSFEDAVALLRGAGILIDPADPQVLVRERPRLTEFEQRHLGPNMGPMQFRGVWYPRLNL
jgi:hypothetical protein